MNTILAPSRPVVGEPNTGDPSTAKLDVWSSSNSSHVNGETTSAERRAVIVKEPGKSGEDPIDVTPKDFSVRTLAQEYGGGDFCISGDTLIFSNYKDQRLYKQSISSTVSNIIFDGDTISFMYIFGFIAAAHLEGWPWLSDSAPLPLTPDYGGLSVCYADGVVDFQFNRYVTVREDQRESGINAITTIVSIDLSSNNAQEPRLLVGGNDFYASPRIDPKGERMAWIEWGHPNMPWDRSELWVGYISHNGDVQKRICVAGGDPTLVESPTEPQWSSQGSLYLKMGLGGSGLCCGRNCDSSWN
ncbi:hypothetical protein T459_19266 [Capsicum annuum]|uniref:Uncharacterized protein n=1 Tax=Capsicum annuum TaxID=4072 RepID=A0A2G2Z1B0_CAPAN|nr:hypothetical protein T459_19266 [Capsicum annuum]